jgi:hypothetical protein
MSKSPDFWLRWRGRVTGPFSLDEILLRLEQHDIGLWHEIGRPDQWMPLGEFLDKHQQEQDRQRTQRPESEGARSKATLPGSGSQPLATPNLARSAPTASPRPALGSGPLTQGPSFSPSHVQGRSHRLFVFLGVLFGFTGAHNFYAGYWGTGLAQALLAAGTMLLGFGFIISWLWALLELLVVRTDARGHPLQ